MKRNRNKNMYLIKIKILYHQMTNYDLISFLINLFTLQSQSLQLPDIYLTPFLLVLISSFFRLKKRFKPQTNCKLNCIFFNELYS